LDATVLVTAPYALKIHRIMERDGSSEAQARARMDHQWSDAQKTPLADFVIKNDERTPILQQLEEMLATIIS
jgi:dephospho-CoA kinase